MQNISATHGFWHVIENRRSLLLNVLPYLFVLILTIIGVAYISVNKKPLIHYWEILAVIAGAVCVLSGWSHA